MRKVCNINIERRQETFEKLKRFIARINSKFSIKRVYLYGSFATGDIHEGSDIDLLIVGDFKGKIFERINEVMKLTNLPIEPLVYRPEQFKKLRKTNPFLNDVIRKGKRLL